MDIQNHYYGHSAILARAAGQSRVRHIPGLVQHGWCTWSPVSSHFHDFPQVGAGKNKQTPLVWSHNSRAWDPEAETHRTAAIGAPFLYLLKMQGGEAAPLPDSRPLIVPFHTTLLWGAVAGTKDLALHYRDKYGPSTVCLHADDLADWSTVDAWREAGHDVVSAGNRFDPLFLVRQLTGLRQASKLVTNRLATAVYYSLAAGIPVELEGPALLLSGETERSVDSLVERWPEMYDPSTSFAEMQEIARAELGADWMRGPEELAEIVGWSRTGAATGAGFDYWALSPARKAAMVLGWTKRIEGRETVAQTGISLDAGAKASSFLKHPLSHLPARLPKMPDLTQQIGWLRPEGI